MKLLLLITGLGVGGAETQILNLADIFSRKGISVSVVYLTGEARLKPVSQDVKLIGFNVKKNIFGLFWAIFLLYRFIKITKPDVVHSHMIHANLISRVVRLIAKIPLLVNTAHSTNEGGAVRMMAYRMTDYLAEVRTNVSAEAVLEFERKRAVPVGTMLMVSNGVNTEIFKENISLRNSLRAENNIEKNVKIFIAVGRLVDAKDYPNLLTAFSLIKNCESVLWIVGDGPLRAKLNELTKKLGIASRVKFFGVSFDVPALINAADIFVLSSAWEGFGLVVAEAMSCRKLVVATDCGGVREVLNGYGFLVAKQNITALANGMKDALNLDEAKAVELCENARNHIKVNFSLEKSVKRWLDIYGWSGNGSISGS